MSKYLTASPILSAKSPAEAGPRTIRIHWTYTGSDQPPTPTEIAETKIRVYRDGVLVVDKLFFVLEPDWQSYTDSAVIPGRPYAYEVCWAVGELEGPRSSPPIQAIAYAVPYAPYAAQATAVDGTAHTTVTAECEAVYGSKRTPPSDVYTYTFWSNGNANPPATGLLNSDDRFEAHWVESPGSTAWTATTAIVFAYGSPSWQSAASAISNSPYALPATPSVTAETNEGSVVVSWSPSAGATGYVVETEGSEDGKWLPVAELGSTTHSYVFPAPGASFQARVVSLNAYGERTSLPVLVQGPPPPPSRSLTFTAFGLLPGTTVVNLAWSSPDPTAYSTYEIRRRIVGRAVDTVLATTAEAAFAYVPPFTGQDHMYWVVARDARGIPRARTNKVRLDLEGARPIGFLTGTLQGVQSINATPHAQVPWIQPAPMPPNLAASTTSSLLNAAVAALQAQRVLPAVPTLPPPSPLVAPLTLAIHPNRTLGHYDLSWAPWPTPSNGGYYELEQQDLQNFRSVVTVVTQPPPMHYTRMTAGRRYAFQMRYVEPAASRPTIHEGPILKFRASAVRAYVAIGLYGSRFSDVETVNGQPVASWIAQDSLDELPETATPEQLRAALTRIVNLMSSNKLFWTAPAALPDPSLLPPDFVMPEVHNPEVWVESVEGLSHMNRWPMEFDATPAGYLAQVPADAPLATQIEATNHLLALLDTFGMLQ